MTELTLAEILAMPWGGHRNLALRDWLYLHAPATSRELGAMRDTWLTHFVDRSGSVQATTADEGAARAAHAALERDLPDRENRCDPHPNEWLVSSAELGVRLTPLLNRAARRRMERDRQRREAWGGA